MKQPVTIVQVAKECGVSVATVSRVMNGTAPVAEKTRAKVNAVIEKYQYHPNAMARGLINRQSMTIGIVMPDITNPYFSAMFIEFEKAAREAGYSVLLCNTTFSSGDMGADIQREREYFHMMLDKRVDGVLIAGGQVDLLEVSQAYKEDLQQLAASVPVVVLGSRIEGVDCLFIQRETGNGVFSAMNYLVSLGHRRIAFVGGEDGVGITETRLSAYLDALRTLRLPCEQELIALSDYYTPDGYRAMADLLGRGTRLTAVLAINDNVAMGVYRALADAGRRIPEDVSVISCDQFYAPDYYIPRLSSVDQHNERFGRFIINALLGAMRGRKENVVLNFTPELVVRESCAPPQPAAE